MSAAARGAALLLPASLAALAHLPALANQYVLDDAALLSENPFVRSLDGLHELLTRELFVASGEVRIVPYYRPLAGFAYWLSFQLVGAHAGAQHAFNVVLHVALVVLLQRLLQKLGVARWPAAAASSVLAVHPAGADIVAYVGGRQDLLGWLCVVAGAWALRAARTLWHVAVVVFASTALATLCREFFFATPLLLLPLALHEQPTPGRGRRAALTLGAGLAAIGAVFLLRHSLGLLPFDTPAEPVTRWLGAHGAVALRLFHDLLLPNDLAVDVTVVADQVAAGVVFLVVPLGVVAYLLLGQPPMSSLGVTLLATSAVSFLCVTTLHSQVALKFGLISDRYAYGLLLGGVWLVAGVLSLRPKSPQLDSATLPVTSILLTAAALVPLTWARVTAYHDEAALQQAMFLDRPDDPQSQLAEGMRQLSAGETALAQPHCRNYARALPNSDRANFCLAVGHFAAHELKQVVSLLTPYCLARPGAVAQRGLLLRALFATANWDQLARLLDELQPADPGAADLQAARVLLDSRRTPAAN